MIQTYSKTEFSVSAWQKYYGTVMENSFTALPSPPFIIFFFLLKLLLKLVQWAWGLGVRVAYSVSVSVCSSRRILSGANWLSVQIQMCVCSDFPVLGWSVLQGGHADDINRLLFSSLLSLRGLSCCAGVRYRSLPASSHGCVCSLHSSCELQAPVCVCLLDGPLPLE